MKSNYLTLLKVYLIQYFAVRGTASERKKAKIVYGILAVCGAVIVAAVCALMYFQFSVLFSLGASARPLIAAGLSSIFMMGAVLVLIFGALAFVSVIFFSKDNEFLLGMPVRTTTVFAVKMTTVYLMELLISLIIYLPTLMTVAVCAGMSGWSLPAAYYVLGLLSPFIMPFIPLMFVALISYPLMYLTTFLKKYSGLGGVILIVVFGAILGGYLYLINSVQNADFGAGSGAANAVSNVGEIFYPGYLYANAMVGSGSFVFNFFVFLGIVLGLSGIAFVLSALLYRKSIAGTLENAKSASAGIDAGKDFRAGGVVKALVKRDFKEIFQNAYLSFVCFSVVLIMPIMSAVMPIAISGGFANAPAGEITAGVQNMFGALAMAVVVMMFMTMGSGNNFIATLAFSREGGNFYILKVLPITERDLIRSKLIIADAVITVAAVLSGIFYGIFAGKTVWDGLIFIALASFYGIAMNGFTVCRDLKNPTLNWLSIKEISRNNARNIVPALVGVLPGMAIVVGAILTAFNNSDPLLFRVVLYVPWLAVSACVFLLFRFNVYGKSRGLIDRVEA